MLGRGNADEFNLGKLMLPDHTVCVFSRRSRFKPKAGRISSITQRQIGFAQDLFSDEIRQRHLRRRDKPIAVNCSELIISEFRQLGSAEHG